MVVSSVPERQRLVKAVRCTMHELQFWSVRFAQRYPRLKAGEFNSQAGWYRVINYSTNVPA